MEAEFEAILQKQWQRVRNAYNRLIKIQPERKAELQQERDAALRADKEEIRTLLERHRKPVDQYMGGRLQDVEETPDWPYPNRIVQETHLMDQLQLLYTCLSQQAARESLQRLLKPYGVPIYEDVMKAYMAARKRPELSPYRIPFAELKRKFPALPQYVLCIVLATARLHQLDEGYFQQERKQDEANLVLGALLDGVRTNLKKAQIYSLSEVGSRGNPIAVPDECAVKVVMDKLEFISGEPADCIRTEKRYGLLLCWAMEYGKNPKRKSALCNHQVYFNIVPDSEAPELRFYPPSFWRRRQRKDEKDESDRNCAKSG